MTSTTLSPSGRPAQTRGFGLPGGIGAWISGLTILAFLVIFLLAPVASVIYTAFVTEEGKLTFGHFMNFFGQSLLKESFVNSPVMALISVVFASLIAIPLACLTVRFEFRGALLIQTLGVLPLRVCYH